MEKDPVVVKKKKSVTARLIDVPSDLKELLDNLDFTEEAVATAARNQPRLVMEAGRYYAKKFKAVKIAEHHLEFVEAEVNIQIRWHDKEKNEKRTEGYIKALITKSKRVNVARKALMRAQVEELYAKQVLQGYIQRNGCIRVVSDLIGNEIAFENKMSSGQVQDLKRVKAKLLNQKRQRERDRRKDEEEDDED